MMMYEVDFKKIKDGAIIKRLCQAQNQDEIIKAEEIFELQKEKYEVGEKKKWISMTVGIIIFGVGMYFITDWVYWATKSRFDRTVIDKYITDKFGSYYFDQLLIDDLIISAFSYNVMEPRFYSKYYAENNATIYNLTIA